MSVPEGLAQHIWVNPGISLTANGKFIAATRASHSYHLSNDATDIFSESAVQVAVVHIAVHNASGWLENIHGRLEVAPSSDVHPEQLEHAAAHGGEFVD